MDGSPFPKRLPAKAPANARLPMVPAGINPYVGPVVPPDPSAAAVPVQGVGDDFEAWQGIITLGANVDGIAAQVPIYTTGKRWRGIDVFVAVPPIPAMDLPAGFGPNEAAIGIQLYAWVQGQLTLVATGRFSALDQVAANPKRVIAYRGPAQKFEVRMSGQSLPDNFATTVSLVACDECVEPSEGDQAEVGVMPAFINGTTKQPMIAAGLAVQTLTIDDFPLEIVGVDVVSGEVAALWFQVLASNDPIFSLPMNAAAGAARGIWWSPAFRTYRANDWTFGVSTTAATFTSAANGLDAGFQVWLR